MKRYRFEIVSRGLGRFGWIFVRINDRGRRVLARSERSYPSMKRVKQAIATLKGTDCIADTTEGDLPLPLPAKSFKIDHDTLPLILDESPVEAPDAVYKVRAKKEGKNDDREEPAAAQEEEEEAVGAAAAGKPATTAKPRARRKRTPRRAS
jgi:hypothetical protein